MSHELKQQLLSGLLDRVQQPGQNVGGEWNAVRKDHAAVDVTVCLAFPDTYAIGMSHSGLQILYSLLNARPDVAAERAFAPWPDMEQELRRAGLPLYSLETFTPLREFDVVGFSLQYEMGYTNLLTMLDLGGIPLHAADRGPDDPLIIAGGPCALSPEPVAEFVDLFLLGDGEETIQAFVDALKWARHSSLAGDRRTETSASRDELLFRLVTRVPSAYAPRLYRVSYNDDGTVRAIEPTRDGVPARVTAAVVEDLDRAHVPVKPVVPFVEIVHDRITLEIMRGCTRGCRFCQAGMTKRPVRVRSAENLVRLAEENYATTGHDEITLGSLSTSDYPDLEPLAREMSRRFDGRRVSLSLPSLRVNEQLHSLPGLIKTVRKSGLTIAPEAATGRLRRVINKDVTDGDLCAGVEEAYRQGWQLVKLYFMVGLPTETEEDYAGIVDLAQRISSLRRRVVKKPARVNVSVAPFVPKAHTPFQWEAMPGLEHLREIRRVLMARLHSRSVKLKFHKPERSLLEGVFSRGDRRLSAVIEEAWRNGARFDAWDEQFEMQRWQDAFARAGLSPSLYANRQRADDEVFPWSHLSAGVSYTYLRAERARAFRGEMTPDCRDAGCRQCGAFTCCTRRVANDAAVR